MTFLEGFHKKRYNTSKSVLCRFVLGDLAKSLREHVPNCRIIIDMSTPGRQEAFLSALRNVPFKDRRYHYAVLNYVSILSSRSNRTLHCTFPNQDFSKLQVNRFSNGNVNVTGIQLIDTESVAYRVFIKNFRRFLARTYPDDAAAQFADIAVPSSSC